MWRLLNPAWSVTVWDQQMLRDWIAANTPRHRDLWTWLESRPARTAEERKALYAKMSDLGRLLLLWKHPGEWNAYTDDDTTPLRSLDSWMAETHWRGHNQRQRGSFATPPLVPVDWSRMNVLFTAENINNRGAGVSLSNSFAMARPGTGTLEAMLRVFDKQRRQNVLRSFGPWAITDFHEKHKNKLKEEGFAAIPWHYFNWIPHHMASVPAPEWTVSIHQQKLRWTGPRKNVHGGGEPRVVKKGMKDFRHKLH
jgi:mannosyltransferase OCH1-like enzyme